MAIDFLDAAGRHRADAELLFEHGRWPNADQLYGLAAECGLKAVMEVLGMPVDARGVPMPLAGGRGQSAHLLRRSTLLALARRGPDSWPTRSMA